MLGLNNTFFVEMVWILCLIGIVMASWYTLVTGFPYLSNQGSFFGLNLNLIYLFIFALLIYGLYNIKYPKERKEKKKPRKR